MWTYFEFASQMTKPFSLLYFVRFGWKKTKVLKWNRADATPGFRFGGSFLVKLMSAHSREGTAYSILVNKILFSFFCYLAKQNWIRNSGRWIRLLHKFRHTLLIVGSFFISLCWKCCISCISWMAIQNSKFWYGHMGHA